MRYIQFFTFICLFLLTGMTSLRAEQEPTVLITGCGRSGTTYITEVLRRSGYDVDHERETGSFGTVSWFAMFEEDRKRHYTIVLHQIRHPLLVIASMHTANPSSWEFIKKRIPEISQNDSLIIKCAKYWYYWNKKAESIAYLSYPLENIDKFLEDINSILGTTISESHLHSVSLTTNTRRHLQLNWRVLEDSIPPTLFKDIVEYSKKWGYKTN